MNFKDLYPPIIEIPAHQTWHCVQRTSARRDSVRFKGYVLAPPGGLAGRFDLADEPTAYLADSPETALYESFFRRCRSFGSSFGGNLRSKIATSSCYMFASF